MKRKAYAYICLAGGIALLLLTGCQEEATVGGVQAASDPDKPSPTISFEKTKHDFGDVPPNQLNTGRIKFTNTGEGVLKITKIDQCCSVVAKLDKDKSKYAPGESGAVVAEWKSGPGPKVFGRQLVVHTNDRANPVVKLELRANIVPQIVWEPERLRLLFDEENAGCPQLTIRCLDDRPFSITEFKSTGDCITADFDPSAKATEFVLEPKVNAEKLHKNLQGQISVGITHPTGNVAVVLFDVVPEYTVRPQSVVLYNPEPGKPIVKKIDVLNNYGKDFEIDSISSKGDIVAVKILEQKKLPDGYQLNLELTVPGDEIPTRFTDEFSISLKGGKKFAIGCRGWSSKKS